MPYKLNRPAADFDSGNGVLCLEHFQMAYVTTDIERAGRLFRERLGIREFTRLEGETPDGGFIKADFAWVGSIMYELIEPQGPGSEIFSDRLPRTEEFVLKHHHLGYLVQSQAQWDALLANAENNQLRIASHSSNPLVEVCFVEVPGLEHYLEYLFASELGMNFFDSVART
ncbi:VOC family protein [Haliea sp. E17]|uniref:VOC family protein n=1 Tax=Haliea sp. E17 TaxID=3401576 RepID=UPI003AAC036F